MQNSFIHKKYHSFQESTNLIILEKDIALITIK